MEKYLSKNEFSKIVHNLRTPIASINAGIGGLKIYLPKLLDCYHLTMRDKLIEPVIPPQHLKTLPQVLANMQVALNEINEILNSYFVSSKKE